MSWYKITPNIFEAFFFFFYNIFKWTFTLHYLYMRHILWWTMWKPKMLGNCCIGRLERLTTGLCSFTCTTEVDFDYDFVASACSPPPSPSPSQSYNPITNPVSATLVKCVQLEFIRYHLLFYEYKCYLSMGTYTYIFTTLTSPFASAGKNFCFMAHTLGSLLKKKWKIGCIFV